jgi:quercetin 2,3-dioxygenase
VPVHCQDGKSSASRRPSSTVWGQRRPGENYSDAILRLVDKPLRALLYAGRPLHEAVIARGPFVMNTEAEIEQAYADYRAARFGPL